MAAAGGPAASAAATRDQAVAAAPTVAANASVAEPTAASVPSPPAGLAASPQAATVAAQAVDSVPHIVTPVQQPPQQQQQQQALRQQQPPQQQQQQAAPGSGGRGLGSLFEFEEPAMPHAGAAAPMRLSRDPDTETEMEMELEAPDGLSGGARAPIRANFASQAAGAVIMGANPEMSGTSSLLSGDADSYALSRCDAKKWVVVQLSEDVIVDELVISNDEKYSSAVHHFRVLGSQKYPTSEWMVLGNFSAANMLGEQTYRILPAFKQQFVRFLKINWLSHYGNEFYCTWSKVRVHGSTLLEDLQTNMFASEVEVNTVKQQLHLHNQQQQQQAQAIAAGTPPLGGAGISANSAGGAGFGSAAAGAASAGSSSGASPTLPTVNLGLGIGLGLGFPLVTSVPAIPSVIVTVLPTPSPTPVSLAPATSAPVSSSTIQPSISPSFSESQPPVQNATDEVSSPLGSVASSSPTVMASTINTSPSSPVAMETSDTIVLTNFTAELIEVSVLKPSGDVDIAADPSDATQGSRVTGDPVTLADSASMQAHSQELPPNATVIEVNNLASPPQPTRNPQGADSPIASPSALISVGNPTDVAAAIVPSVVSEASAALNGTRGVINAVISSLQERFTGKRKVAEESLEDSEQTMSEITQENTTNSLPHAIQPSAASQPTHGNSGITAGAIRKEDVQRNSSISSNANITQTGMGISFIGKWTIGGVTWLFSPRKREDVIPVHIAALSHKRSLADNESLHSTESSADVVDGPAIVEDGLDSDYEREQMPVGAAANASSSTIPDNARINDTATTLMKDSDLIAAAQYLNTSVELLSVAASMAPSSLPLEDGQDVLDAIDASASISSGSSIVHEQQVNTVPVADHAASSVPVLHAQAEAASAITTDPSASTTNVAPAMRQPQLQRQIPVQQTTTVPGSSSSSNVFKALTKKLRDLEIDQSFTNSYLSDLRTKYTAAIATLSQQVELNRGAISAVSTEMSSSSMRYRSIIEALTRAFSELHEGTLALYRGHAHLSRKLTAIQMHLQMDSSDEVAGLVLSSDVENGFVGPLPEEDIIVSESLFSAATHILSTLSAAETPVPIPAPADTPVMPVSPLSDASASDSDPAMPSEVATEPATMTEASAIVLDAAVMHAELASAAEVDAVVAEPVVASARDSDTMEHMDTSAQASQPTLSNADPDPIRRLIHRFDQGPKGFASSVGDSSGVSMPSGGAGSYSSATATQALRYASIALIIGVLSLLLGIALTVGVLFGFIKPVVAAPSPAPPSNTHFPQYPAAQETNPSTKAIPAASNGSYMQSYGRDPGNESYSSGAGAVTTVRGGEPWSHQRVTRRTGTQSTSFS
jgi:hypothetical protein